MIFLKLKFNKKQQGLKRSAEGSKKGLTMVETLVAISILTIAVIGPLGIIAQALRTSYYTRDQMTAYYLAQEAIEYVRNLRDNQGINITQLYAASLENPNPAAVTPSWLENVIGSTTPQIFINPYSATSLTRYSLIRDANVYSFIQYSDGDPNSNYLKISNGIYGDTTALNATTSIFKREIYFQETANGSLLQEFVMVVNVYWKNGSYPAKLTLKEYFTNWTSKTGS
jgi:hypothetical protein